MPERLDPDARAGLRLGTALAATALSAALVVPLAWAVRGDEGAVVDLDRRVTRAADDLVAGRDGLVTALHRVTDLGDPLLLTVLAVGLALWLARRGSTRLALFVVAARVGAVVLSTSLKAAVDRVRPLFEEPVATALGASFPSGHALGSAAFCTSTALVALSVGGRRVRVAALALAVVVPVAVAASRVLLGVHYLSDVVAGLVLGAAWVAVCAAVFASWRREEGRGGVALLEEGPEPEAAGRTGVSPRSGP